MGSKYTVEAWGQHHVYGQDDTSHSYLQVWQGQSLIGALWALWQTKRAGYRCVKLEVR